MLPVKTRPLHSWQVSREEALALQLRLAKQVLRSSAVPAAPRLIGGVDLSPPDPSGVVQGAVVVLDYPSLEVREVATATMKPLMEYHPGLLAFREAPVLAAALENLTLIPDLLMVDGQGLAHPRRFGIACHLGLLTDLPTLGCAKSRLCGEERPPPSTAGSFVNLTHREEVIGAIVRTQTGRSPLYISIGHKIDLTSAVSWVLACCRGYRLPEPTRLAHEAAAGRLAIGERKKEAEPLTQQARLL